MSDAATSPPAPGRWLFTIVLTLVVAGSTVGVMMLWQNISARQEEGKQVVFAIVDLHEDVVDPAEWGKNYPRQFESYKKTVDTDRTIHGGSEAFQKLDVDPAWRTLYKGYAFGVDFREERGHAYMLSDQDMTERTHKFKQLGACLHCHASILPAYREAGIKAGASKDEDKRQEAIQKGFEQICPMPLAEARQLVKHPVACVDCHEPKSMALRVTRPGFLHGIQTFAEAKRKTADGTEEYVPAPHLPSIERWRKGSRLKSYDPNREASRQEMRSMACGQCHVEYYFKGPNKLVTYPWAKGLQVEQIEEYYQDAGFKDWTHEITRADMLKAQHPEFELWSQGIHARSGVACADCHMPYKREGAIKISDHQVRSPYLNVARACQVCHHSSETEIKGRIQAIQDRTKKVRQDGEKAVLDLVNAIKAAQDAGIAHAALLGARQKHRQAQWRLDFIYSENSSGFHAPQEAMRILAEALDLARQGQVEAVRLTAAKR